jgi:predicted dienelactone hydrolase
MPSPASEVAAYPLGDYGPYHVGTLPLTTRDAARRNRAVSVTVWYPALQPAGFSGPGPSANAEPDPAGGPYPLILSSTTMARRLAPLVVSHGFVWASVDNIDTYRSLNPETVEQPRDIVAALDLVASAPPASLRGLVDTEHAGAVGYSFDGMNAYTLGGARIDPAYYRAQCPTPDAATEPLVRSGYTAFDCLDDRMWEMFVDRAGPIASPDEDGLWQPMTDPRIRAVMPMAGEGWWLFGERGLAAFDRPALLITGSADELYAENVLMYRHLGTQDKTFISLLDVGHLRVLEPDMMSRLAHFAVAFFGFHLAERGDLSYYLTEAFVEEHPELDWGVPDED